MYQAPIVAALIGISALWNIAGLHLEKKGFKVPLFCHHYGMMYGMLIVLFCMACQSMYDDVMVPSNWLDEETTRNFVIGVMQTNNEYDDGHSEAFTTWQSEATLTDYPTLKEFSMLSPVWCLLTIVVCIWHTHQHINKIRENRDEGEGTKGRLMDCPQHNQTMTVLVLPAVYGLLSFKSTCRMWQVMINHIPVPGGHHDTSLVAFSGYVERKTFLLEMYDANFMVGDIYETYALVTFGNLVMGVLKKKIDHMKEIFERETADRNDAGEMREMIEKLVDSMKTLTVAGVKLFALSCLLQGVYTLVITTCAFDFPDLAPHYFSRDANNLGVFQQPEMKATAHNFFLGAGFIASFAAIGNIMIIEEDFESLLEEFKPSMKFWGTKILVSLAFLQSILISVFLTPAGWSEIQTDLLYSSCLGLECLLIALFHIKGWSAEEKWYGDYMVAYGRPSATMKEPLLKSASKVPMENK